MKKKFRTNCSALHLMVLLIGTATTLTGCSSDESIIEGITGNNQNEGITMIRARISLDNATTRSTGEVSNELGSWGYSEETGLTGYPFAWPEFAYEPNGKAVFSGIATTTNSDHYSDRGDWLDAIVNITSNGTEYYTKIDKGTNLLSFMFNYYNTPSSPEIYAHVMFVYGRYGKEIKDSENSGVYKQAKYDLSESDIVSGKSLSFTQKGKNSIHLDDYVGMWAKGTVSKAQFADESNANESEIAQFTFHHLSTIFRFIVKNKSGQEVTINKVEMKESKEADLFPASVVYGYADYNNGTGSTMPDPDVKDYNSTTLLNSVAVNLDSNGTTWNTLAQTDDKLAAYGLAICNPSTDISANNFQFGVTDSEGKEYTSLVLSGERIKTHVNGAEDDNTHAFLPGYVYTFTLLVDENKLTLGGVSVNGWGDDVDGGEATGNTLMSLTNWCSTDTYKAQREALTTLTIDGSTITATERANYLQANLPTYFPKVTTLNFTGKNIAVSWIQPKGVDTLLSQAISVPTYCFRDGVTSTIRNVSLPNLKAFSGQILFGISVANVCFASLTDCSKADQEFTTNSINIAFGATEEFNFGTKTPANIMRYYGTATLYLNENGYEYLHNVSGNTWRGITFAAIKKYSEYPGKKD